MFHVGKTCKGSLSLVGIVDIINNNNNNIIITTIIIPYCTLPPQTTINNRPCQPRFTPLTKCKALLGRVEGLWWPPNGRFTSLVLGTQRLCQGSVAWWRPRLRLEVWMVKRLMFSGFLKIWVMMMFRFQVLLIFRRLFCCFLWAKLKRTVRTIEPNKTKMAMMIWQSQSGWIYDDDEDDENDAFCMFHDARWFTNLDQLASFFDRSSQVKTPGHVETFKPLHHRGLLDFFLDFGIRNFFL